MLVRAACAAAIGAALAAASAHSGPAAASSLQVLDIVPLPAEGAGLRVREISGLAWDADEATLLAISDKGVLHRMTVQIDGDARITGVTVRASRRIDSSRVDAESLAVRHGNNGKRGDGQVVVSDEKRNQLVELDSSDMASARLDMPAALAGPRMNTGVEAIEVHPSHGVIAVLQRPNETARPIVHRLHAADGRSWAVLADRSARASIKGMHLLDDRRIVLLEKLRVGETNRAVLREVNLDGCAATAPCDPPSLPLTDAGLKDADNAEGIACISTTLCLIATDDGASEASRGLLILIRLVR
jgi:hypothetical protein